MLQRNMQMIPRSGSNKGCLRGKNSVLSIAVFPVIKMVINV